jgi:N-acetylated-alpha-linked acidic dipeptidase
MKIPVLPISYRDARLLFDVIGGDVAPVSWRGAMPVTYRIGGQNAVRIRLKVLFNWDLRPAYNVLAKLTGSEYPDQWIIRGNHHDAWVIGAHDPASGMVALLEQARATAVLTKSGWKPRRTIVFCAWDAEEPGLLGSTEWVEEHGSELDKNAVAYINTDGNSRGFLKTFEGSHSLQLMAVQATQDVTDPQTGVPISDRLRALLLIDSGDSPATEVSLRLEAPGCGSDYSPFIQHLGIASLNLGFSGEGTGGEYHTMFDTYDHYCRHLDPKFEYGIALTTLCGLVTLRLVEADLVPFDFEAQAATIKDYAIELEEVAGKMRETTARHNAWLEEGIYELVADPVDPKSPPEPKAAVPYLNFAPLNNAVDRLQAAANRYAKAQTRLLSGELTLSTSAMAELNQILFRSERTLIREKGLPGRPWFRHQLYAPGRYTGYSVKTLPGIREAIEERQWDEVDGQIEQAATHLEELAETINRATHLIAGN